MLLKLITVLLVLFFIWILFFHKAIPIFSRRTGRNLRDLKKAGDELIGGEEVPGSPLARYEAQVGKAVTARILMDHPLSEDMALQEKIVRIGEKLASASSRREVNFRFAVLEDDEPNAMSILGGSVFITTGLIQLGGGDEHKLAGILGHEVAHIDCRHAIKSHATRAITRAGFQMLTFGRGMVISRLAGTVQNMVQEGYNRDKELEADRVGAQLASRAGYHSGALAEVFKDLLEGAETLKTCPYFKNHPSLPDRIQALQ